jgi:hypothetical protein
MLNLRSYQDFARCLSPSSARRNPHLTTLNSGSCPMTKHYILNLDPNARYEWDRRTLRDPITADHPALADLIAEAIGEEAGSYLVSVQIDVKVLEKASVGESHPATLVEVPPRSPVPQLAEVA